MPSAFQIKSFLTYWLDAVDEHSLHSPFFFDFYTRVVRQSSSSDSFASIEALRKKLLHSVDRVQMKDLGANSQKLNGVDRKISDIARTSLSAMKYSSLYARIVQHFGYNTIVELGTSLGINTLYLAAAGGRVTTFEGVPEIIAVARSTFASHGAGNIDLREGNIDQTLPAFLNNARKIDLAFMDANHRYEPTMRYASLLMNRIHHRGMIIMDDIHYSPEMEAAWQALQKNPLVYGSADLYRCGILFFDPSLNKQHVVLQF